MKRVLVILPILFFAGCETTRPSQVVDLSPLSRQIANLSDANADLKVVNERLTKANADLLAANEQLKATLRADADAGLAANTKGWLPFEQYVWGHQIQLLPVVPDAGTTTKWAEASTLYAAGGESAMQGVVNDLTTQAGQLNTRLGELTKAAETAQEERDAAQKTADEAMQRAQKAEQDIAAAVAKAIADEDARIAAETRAWQVRMANWAGAGLGALAAGCIAGAFFISAASKKFGEAAAIALALCVGFFAFARLLSHPWFLPVAVGLYVVAGASWAAWKIRTGIREREEAEEDAKARDVANRYAEFGKDVVPLIDDIYESKTPMQAWVTANPQGTESDYIDERLLTALGDSMSAGAKATVHEIRASIALAKSDTVL